MTDDQMSIGELQRTCERIEEALASMRAEAKADRHLLANRIEAHGVTLAVHTEQIRDVVEKQSGARQWIAGVVSGGIVGAIVMIWEKLTK